MRRDYTKSLYRFSFVLAWFCSHQPKSPVSSVLLASFADFASSSGTRACHHDNKSTAAAVAAAAAREQDQHTSISSILARVFASSAVAAKLARAF